MTSSIDDFFLSLHNFMHQTYDNPEPVQAGHSRVLRISEHHVAKLMMNIEFYDFYSKRPHLQHFQDSLNELVRVNNIWKIAYKDKLIIPEYHGLFLIKVKGLTVPSLVLDYVPGVDIKELIYDFKPNQKRGIDSETLDEIKEQCDNGLNKAKFLGYTPDDHDDYRNFLWNPEEIKSYIIDLDGWKNPRSEKL